MNIHQVLTPTFVYLVPIGFFMYMGIDVLLRNPRKVEHRLISVIMCCYGLLFLEEYVRFLLPMAYSPALVALWFGNVGAIIPSLGVHFIVKFSRLDKKLPRYFYPYMLYLPLIFVVLTLIESRNIFNSQQFVQMGLWKVPVYNTPYFTALSVGCMIMLVYLVIILKGRSAANTKEQKAIHNQLILGVLFVLSWTIVFGYINFGSSLPPYPYMYAGLIWGFFLRVAMIKYDFLNFSGKRYEILFNLNPAAILLVDLSGRIKEANPSARQLFHRCDCDAVTFYDLFLPEERHQWTQQLSGDIKKIKDREATICSQNHKVEVLIDGEYVLVENEPHFILILRDITLQKINQEEIRFLAYHDPLTRLPNRRYFYEKLEQAIEDAKQHHRQLAVIILDLDLFKKANDQYGHKVGDDVLQHVAGIIQETVGDAGMTARLGGDEFVIFLDRLCSPHVIEPFIRLLQDGLKQHPFIYEQTIIPIEMSIGVSLFPDHGENVDALVVYADKSMYQVKRSGRNSYKFS